MPTTLALIEAEALKLTSDERAELAERLWASVSDGAAIDPAWAAEVARRMQEIDSGAVQCRPWAEVMSDLRSKHE